MEGKRGVRFMAEAQDPIGKNLQARRSCTMSFYLGRVHKV